MRMSRLFSQTLRDNPSEVDMPGHQFLLRAGFIHHISAGIFSYLPLAQLTLNKIENILRQEIKAIGGQEITMPVIHQAEIWHESSQSNQRGSKIRRFMDNRGFDMAFSSTHEDIVAELARKEVHSYRQLPQLIYHIQTKWRDDAHPRSRLTQSREFTMQESFSLDATMDGLDKQYRAHCQAYTNIFNRCALPFITSKSFAGTLDGVSAQEFIYLTSTGEDTLVICKNCGYSANQQVARFIKPPHKHEELKPVEEVATPGVKTIEGLTKFLNLPHAKTAKAVFLIATIDVEGTRTERFVFALVRGDMEVNETKLAYAISALDLRPATDVEIRSVGAIPGYASPIGLSNVHVIVDDLIPVSSNLVSGANHEGYHLLNVNYGRDYHAQTIADITVARDGHSCIQCGNPLHTFRGIKVGKIVKLGTRYSEAMGCTYLDSDGKNKSVVMGSYSICSERLMACIAEEHHDEQGLIWPITIAPYSVHLVNLVGKAKNELNHTEQIAHSLYNQLENAGIEVLFDDRNERPGVKFNDADLIGCPIRLTVSDRALDNGGIEVKIRNSQTREIIPVEKIQSHVLGIIQSLEQNLSNTLVEIDKFSGCTQT